MEYTKQLIQKAKGKPCKICYEMITESEADGQEFLATKTNLGGIALYIPGVGIKRRE